MGRCAKMLKKAFLPVFRDCRWVTFHGIYSSQMTSLVSCLHPCSVVRHSHNGAAGISCQKLEHRSLVQVCGVDVLAFLQGLVTNDIRLLETDGSAVYAMMLNVQACITYVYCSQDIFTKC